MNKSPARSRRAPWLIALAMSLPLVLTVPTSLSDHGQNDAGSGGDAGDTLATSTAVVPSGEYTGLLSTEASDPSDYYKFPVAQGAPINVEIRDVLIGGFALAPENQLRLSFRLLDPNGVLLDTPNTNQGDTRVTLAAAPLAGDYRFQVTRATGGFTGDYRFCFLAAPPLPHPCPDIGMRPQSTIFGGSIDRTLTRVLLVPPTHGDLGNLAGPTTTDYLNAALNGIREWERVLDDFAADYPQYDYLTQITVQIFLFDGTQVFADYDVVIGYVETGGTLFRGAALDCVDTPRCIALSLFSISPRSGQVFPDYPEINDMDIVVKHEFAHTWGLGHTLTWTSATGPDLMNSPATFVYGDGNPIGDGGERTAKKCISSLNLYGMALLYQWLDGLPKITDTWYELPAGIPYELYC